MVNITNYFENMTGVQELLNIPNQQTGGYWFWLGMLILIFAVLLVNLIGFGFESAMITSAFVCLIAGLFLVYLELLSWQWLMLFLGTILLILFYVVWNNKKTI